MCNSINEQRLVVLTNIKCDSVFLFACYYYERQFVNRDEQMIVKKDINSFWNQC